MKCLVTGAAGFIGMHTCLQLLKKKIKVLGIDNLNKYYSKNLKIDRLKILKKNNNFIFRQLDISDFSSIKKIFKKFKPKYVINLAAQAGVRHSINNPFDYTNSNLVGFANILECCKIFKIKHLVFASSSSVYGGSTNYPFRETERVDQPINYYAATKKSNEIMAYSYSHLFKIPMTGLRFFTVYGPWGRPDMFLFMLIEAIKKNKTIKIFNDGNMYRDFTYVEDVSKAINKILKKSPNYNKYKSTPYKIFNIGSNKPIYLRKFISVVEKICKKKVKKISFGMQKGDIKFTHANIKSLYNWIKFKPSTNIENGIKKFVEWHNKYYT